MLDNMCLIVDKTTDGASTICFYVFDSPAFPCNAGACSEVEDLRDFRMLVSAKHEVLWLRLLIPFSSL